MKKLLIITLASLTLLTLSGCGKKEEKKTEENKPVETKEEEKIESYSFKTNLNNEEINVKFEYQLVPRKEKAQQRLVKKDGKYMYVTPSDKVYNVSIYVNDNKVTEINFDEDVSIKEMIEGVKSQTIKGTDKEYLILTLLDKNNIGKLLIINKTTKLLDAKIIENLEYKVSDDIKKYDVDGNGIIDKFYRIEEDKIYYLYYYDTIYDETPYYQVFEEYEITIDNDKVINKLIKNGLKASYDENYYDSYFFNIYGGEIINKEEIKGSYKFTTKLNNKNVEIKIDYKTSETAEVYQDFSYYPVDVIFSVNNKKIGNITFNSIDENSIKNVKNTILKGNDKEYLAIIYVPEDSPWPQEYIYIISENKLIGLVYTETNLWITLSGSVSDKYKPVNDYRKYYNIENGKLYYLRPQDKYVDREIEDKIEIDEYVINLNNDKISKTKTGNILTGTDPEGGDSNLCEFEEF